MARLTDEIKAQLEKIVSEKGCCLSSEVIMVLVYTTETMRKIQIIDV